MKYRLLYFIALIMLSGCIGGGTHGAIKTYRYNISKYNLEKAVRQTMMTSLSVFQDSVKDYYNDDSNYVTMKIVYGNEHFRYTFRYYGGKKYWDTSRTSAIFIAYAYDSIGHGGSEGNGGITWRDFSLKKRLTQPFEAAFILKIDSLLGMNHTAE